MFHTRVLPLFVSAVLYFNQSSAQNERLVLPAGHQQKVTDLKFSADELLMASASEDNSIKIWSTQSGKLLQDLQGHTDEVFKIFFFPSSQKILSASRDRTIRTWNIYSGKALVEYSVPEGIRDCFFTKDGKKLVIVTFQKIINLDAETGKEISVIQNEIIGGSISADLSRDEKLIVLTKENHLAEAQVRVWDLGSDKNYPVELSGCPWGARQSFFYNDSLVISHCLGRAIYVTNFQKGESRRIELEDEVSAIYLNRVDNTITTIFKNNRLFSGTLDHYAQVNAFPGKPGAIADIKFNSSTKKYMLLSGDDDGVFTDSYELSFTNGEAPLFKPVSNPGKLTSAFISESGKYMAMVSEDGRIKMHNGLSGQELFVMSNHLEDVNAMYCIKNDIILTGDGKGFVKKWEMSSGKLTAAQKFSRLWIEAIDYSPRDCLIVIGTGSGDIHIVGLADFLPRSVFSIENSRVTACAFSHDGKFVAGYLENNENGNHSVIVWDVKTGKEVFRKPGFFYKGNSPFIFNSGQILFGDYADMSLNIYDVETGRLVSRIKTGFEIQNFSTSADGTIMTALSRTDNIKWWNIKDQKLIAQAKKPGSQFTDARISPDNKLIVTNSYDGSIDAWNVSSGKNQGSFTTGYGYNRMKFIAPAKLIVESNKLVSRLDLLTMKAEPIASGTWLQQWQNQSWFENLESVVTLNNGSSFSFFPLSGKKDPTIFCNIDSLDYLTLLPDGYYLTSPRASKLLHYVDPQLRVITFDQLDVKFNRPDKVLESIGKSDTVLVNSFRQAYQKRVKKLGIDTTAFSGRSGLPEADFTNRASVSYEQPGPELLLKIQGSGKGSVLKKFQVWINETPLFGMKGIELGKRSVNAFDTSIRVQLSSGLNIIETSVTNSQGIESYRMPLNVVYNPVVAVSEKLYFIGIGVDKYKESSHNLNYSVKDIRDLAVKLKEKYKTNIVIDTLFNENVTLSNVAALKKNLFMSGVNDKIIVSFSGHGLLSRDYDYYLSTYDVEFASPENKGLPYEMLESLLDSIPARKKLMLIDACHSGEVDKEEMQKYKTVQSQNRAPGLKGLDIENTDSTSGFGMKNSFELMQELFANVGRSTGATIISAAAGTQLAQERGDLKNGVFTYSILEYLKSHAIVPLSALREYVNKRVPELTSGLQVPTTRTETNQGDWEL